MYEDDEYDELSGYGAEIMEGEDDDDEELLGDEVDDLLDILEGEDDDDDELLEGEDDDDEVGIRMPRGLRRYLRKFRKRGRRTRRRRKRRSRGRARLRKVRSRALRRYPLGLGTTSIGIGASAIITLNPQLPFKLERLSSPAAGLVIDNIQVGVVSQFVAAGGVAVEVFGPTATGVGLRGDTAIPGVSIQITVTNPTAAAVVFSGALIGLVAQ